MFRFSADFIARPIGKFHEEDPLSCPRVRIAVGIKVHDGNTENSAVSQWSKRSDLLYNAARKATEVCICSCQQKLCGVTE